MGNNSSQVSTFQKDYLNTATNSLALVKKQNEKLSAQATAVKLTLEEFGIQHESVQDDDEAHVDMAIQKLEDKTDQLKENYDQRMMQKNMFRGHWENPQKMTSAEFEQFMILTKHAREARAAGARSLTEDS